MATDFNAANLTGLTITQLYENEELLRYLMNEIGITTEVCRNRIVNDGFNSLRAVVGHHSNDIEGVKSFLTGLNKTFASSADATLRVYYSPVVIARFCGIVHYYDQAVNSFHCIPDPSFINVGVSDDLSRTYNEFKKKADMDNTDDVEIEIPKLTGASNWINFRDKFLMKLGVTIGSRGIPLTYVVDTTERDVKRANATLVEVDTLDLDDEDTYPTKTVQFGRGYKDDNKQVWLMLKSLLLGTPVYNHVGTCDSTSNGSKAWNSLTQFYEGEDFQARLKDSGFSKLLHTFYRGDTARFNFEKYISAHKEAHKMLEDSGYNNGAGLDDATKCHHFISGIKENAGLEYALSTARANPQYRTFSTLISFLSAEVDHRNIRKQQLRSTKDRDRSVSALKNDKGKGKGKEKNNNFPSRNVDGKTVYGKRYAKHEFKKLTKNQKQAVIQLQRDARNKKSDSKPENLPISAITIDDLATVGDAIIAGVKQAQSAETEETADNSTVASDITGATKRKAPAGGVGNYLASRRKAPKI